VLCKELSERCGELYIRCKEEMGGCSVFEGKREDGEGKELIFNTCIFG